MQNYLQQNKMSTSIVLAKLALGYPFVQICAINFQSKNMIISHRWNIVIHIAIHPLTRSY